MATAEQAAPHAGMTDEEIAALADLEAQMADTDADDPLFDPSAVVTGGEEQEEAQDQQERADQQAADEEAAAGAEAEQAADAEAAKSQGKPEDQQADQQEDDPFSVANITAPRTPMLNATAPDGADERLEAISAEKAALSEKFDDGDLTSKEYQAQLDKLNKEERTIELQLHKATLARELEEQRITQERMADINSFLGKVGIPYDAKNLRFQVLDAAIRVTASDPANASLSVTETLQKAYDTCVAEGVLPAPKQQESAKQEQKQELKQRKPVNAPPTLASMPASEVTSPEDNRFAYLNRITDPDKREAAFAKLSPADQEAYLETGG